MERSTTARFLLVAVILAAVAAAALADDSEFTAAVRHFLRNLLRHVF
jgi:hypothetical protein